MNKLEFKIIQDYCNGVSPETISRNLYLSEDFVKETIEKYKGEQGVKEIRSDALFLMCIMWGFLAGWMLVQYLSDTMSESNSLFNVLYWELGVYVGCILGSFCIFVGINKWSKV